MKGSYILLIELATEKDILIGKLGSIHFPEGFYASVGSAMNGLEARLAYHLKDNKKPYWHIDYLLKEAKFREAILCLSEQRTECILARALAKELQSVPDFGASDCKCKSHLYFGEEEQVKAKVIGMVKQVGLVYKIFFPKELRK